MARMLGCISRGCRARKNCGCCNVPPGKHRREGRRNEKRSERNQWRQELRSEI